MKPRYLTSALRELAAQLGDEQPSRAFAKFLGYLGLGQGLQLVGKPGIHRWHRVGDVRVLVASATALSQWI